MKFFSLLLITILIATFVVASPTPSESGSKEIHVTSPGHGPWAVKSTQNISWWSLHIPSDGKFFELLIYLKIIYLIYDITNEKILNKIAVVVIKVIDKNTDKVVFEDKVSIT